jgi:hypothetical protein
MNRMHLRVLGLLLALSLLVPFQNAMAKKPLAPGALTLPLAGAVADVGGGLGAGKFSGTVTINRFARTSDGGIVAVGIASGSITTLSGQVVRTGLETVVLPVSRGLRTANFAPPPSAEPRLVRVSSTQATSGRFILAQAASCQILNLDIGGIAVNLLGFMVNLSPITLDISGDSAGPLGALACEIVALLGTVADVVGLLNDLLGLLTGLLGGVVGGIGGIGG